jgi:hypothetical protein
MPRSPPTAATPSPGISGSGKARSTSCPTCRAQRPPVDPYDHHLFVSLGCAAENLAIAAVATGRPGELETGSDGGFVRCAFSEGAARPDPLLKAIPVRRVEAVIEG